MIEPSEKECLFCGKLFIGLPNKKYCCEQCRYKKNSLIRNKQTQEDLKALKIEKTESKKKPKVKLSKAEAVELYHNYAEIQKQKTLELIGKIGD